MTYLKRSGAKNHRSTDRDTSPPEPRPVNRAGRAGCAKIRLKFANEDTAPFAEDFYGEHSLAGVSMLLAANSASSKSAGPVTARTWFGKKPNSPSCVYLG
jgi:hypothetical protein